jgi:hypothetical protein
MSAAVLSLVAAPALLNDVVAGLRNIADILERDIAAKSNLIGSANVVCRTALVVRISGEEPRVYAHGSEVTPAQTFQDLHIGAQQLMMMLSAART